MSGAPAPVVYDCCDRCGQQMAVCGHCGAFVEQHPAAFGTGFVCHEPQDVRPDARAKRVTVNKQTWDSPADIEVWCSECAPDGEDD